MKKNTSLRGRPKGLTRQSSIWIASLMLALTLMGFTNTAHAEADITTGLVGHWRLDETSGTTAADSSGNSYDGTLSGGMDAATGSVAGKLGTALNFNGSGNYIDLSATAGGALVSQGAVTASVWVKPTTITSGVPFSASQDVIAFSAGGGTVQSRFSITIGNSDEVGVGGRSADGDGFQSFITTTSPLHVGEWNHIVGVIDYANDTISVYVNGAFVDSGAVTFSLVTTDSTNSSNVAIGSEDNGSGAYFDGVIDDARVYTRALSAEDIAYLYQSRDGNIKYDTDARVPKFFDGDNWQSMTGGPYVPGAVYFDSVSDYLQQSPALTGVTDGKQGTLSVWFKMDAADQDKRIFRNSSSRFTTWFENLNGGQIVVRGENTASSGVLEMATTSFNSDTSGWHHLLASWDLTDPAKRHLYLDGVEDLDPVNHTTHIDDFIEYSAAYYRIGAKDIASEMWQGDMADLWVSTDTYIDLSVPQNREKFITSGGDPVDLGPGGEYPTGSAPAIFLSGDTATWHTNKGTGGGFTENGALTDAATKPGQAVGVSCNTIGGTCDDGSIYAGLSPDGDVPMYTTPADAPGTYTWNDGTTNYTDMSMANCTDVSPGTAATCQTGEANTAFLVGATGEPDYPFAAAEYCDGLSAHGYDDWYLPAQDELNVLYTYKNTGDLNGTFNETGSLPAGYYWSSPESYSNDLARYQRFSNGLQGSVGKDNGIAVRCVRKQVTHVTSDISCSNPVRPEGSIIYNADNNIMQYCDGKIWRSIGSPIGAGTGGCSNPSRSEGAMIFNKDYGAMQYCDGDDWITVGTYDACGNGAATIGTTCGDGSIYAGASPDGGLPMYMTALAYETLLTWDSAAYGLTSVANTTTGEANTAALIALGAGFDAAAYCSNLTAHGKSDWYLPAEDETGNFWNGGSPIGGVLEDGSYYWASTEFDATRARARNFSAGGVTQTAKVNPLYVRCVRKD